MNHFPQRRLWLVVYCVFALLAFGCAAGRKTTVLTKNDVPRSVERVNVVHGLPRFESEIILGLARNGITAAPQNDAPFVLEITTDGVADFCVINDSIQYANATFMLKDAKTMEALMAVSKGGWTGPCAYHQGDLFGELAALLVEALRARGTVALADRWPDGSTPTDRDRSGGTFGGTGFFIAPNGFVVTAQHVVENAKSITVILNDGTELPATPVTSSKATDIAILKIEAEGVSFLSLAPGAELALGDEVYTIGFPAIEILGDNHKYADGKVSSLSGVEGDTAFLQVTVPVQPGNSGGPLVDRRGRAVGVVTSTAAIEAFYRLTGSLPQGITWAVKSEYISAVTKEATMADPSVNRTIADVQAAVCRVKATR